MLRKVIFCLFISLSIFVAIDKVSALPTGDSMSTSSEKVVLGKFLHGSGGSMNMYAFNGTGNSCGTYQNPDSNAPISCWYNHNLSLTAPSYHSDVNPNSWGMVFYPQISLKKDHVYRVELVGITSNSTTALYFSEDKIKSVKNANLISSQTSVSDFEITYTVVFTMTSDMVNEIQLDMSKTDINLRDFDDAWGYMFMPKIEDITSEVFGFKDVSPSVTMVETSSQIAQNFNSVVNNLSPTLTYGESTYNYIFNDFIPNKLYLEYGDYYICGGIGVATTTDCYISDSPDVFTMRYGYNGNSVSPDYTFFYVDVNPTSEHKVYKYRIAYGSKHSNSSYITSTTNILSSSPLNDSHYMPTNVSYFKMGDTTYNTIKTADGYMFNPGDIVLYKDGTDFVVNTEYKTSISKYDTYTLSNLEYSAIEIKFNVDDFPMIDEGNDIKLDYEIKLDTDMIIPLLPIPQEKIYRNMALGDYSIGTTMNLLFDEKANNYVYEGTKHYDYWNTITYRFEFPFTNDYVGNITLNFWSDSNYTITLEERSNEENDIKYTELDLTGKYGVGFIPKVSSFDVYNEFYGIFKVPYQNNYRLMFYKDYSYVSQNNKSNLILDKVLLTFENFEYKFTKENKNSYLLFINNNYESGSEASILYNSNYFNYCILDEELSSCDIINPNTEENVTINPNLGDLDSFGVKDILHSFKTFSDSTNFILENVTNFYNNFLPDELKIFFFISFGFAVIIMITKIVL